jgi:hypothetical protein
VTCRSRRGRRHRRRRAEGRKVRAWVWAEGRELALAVIEKLEGKR